MVSAVLYLESLGIPMVPVASYLEPPAESSRGPLLVGWCGACWLVAVGLLGWNGAGVVLTGLLAGTVLGRDALKSPDADY